MPEIDTKVVTHHLIIHHSAKLLEQRKQKVGEENMIAIDEKVGKHLALGSLQKPNTILLE